MEGAMNDVARLDRWRTVRCPEMRLRSAYLAPLLAVLGCGGAATDTDSNPVAGHTAGGGGMHAIAGGPGPSGSGALGGAGSSAQPNAGSSAAGGSGGVNAGGMNGAGAGGEVAMAGG